MPVPRKKLLSPFYRKRSTKSRFKIRRPSSGPKIRPKSIFKNLKRKLGLLLLAVISIGITTAILTGVSAYKFINAPFTSASYLSNTDGGKIWTDDKEQIHLALLIVNDKENKYSEIKNLSLINFDKTTSRYTIYHIPVDEEVEYALNAGNGPLRRIYAVGNADQDRGIYLLEKTLLKLLAVKIDGYIIIDQSGFDEIESLMGEIDSDDLSASLRIRNSYKIPSLFETFRNVAITDLKIEDLWNILDFIRGTSHTSSKEITLNKYQLLDPNNWDNLWQEKLSISNVQKESVKVYVANCSDPKIIGLANWGARVVKNLGASVLDTKNSESPLKENTIVTKNPDLFTVKLLKETLSINKVYAIEDLPEGEYDPEIYRSEISLILVNF